MKINPRLKRKKITAAELPEEVIHREILTRLPIKSAVRFNCVSKSWLSLFSNPQFVKQHLTYNFTQNPNDSDCLITKKHTGIVILSRNKETLALPFHRLILVGSVRGLVCLKLSNKLSLWNPAIHQSKEFFIPPQRSRHYVSCIGFGFDPVSDNYKVVVVSNDSKFASVYYSNSDDWIDISVPDSVSLESRGYSLKSSITITIVKDCPYWTLAKYIPEPRRLHLVEVYLTAVKFDTVTNEFKVLPEFYSDVKVSGKSYAFGAFGSEFVDMNDCLTLIVYDRCSSKCMLDIYSLDGEEGCCVWGKMYTIGPLNFSRGPCFVSQGFYGGEAVFRDGKMFSCYDHKTNTIKHLSTNFKRISFFSCFRYTPSLVFLEGMRSVHLTTQTRRTSGVCSRVPRRLISSLKN